MTSRTRRGMNLFLATLTTFVFIFVFGISGVQISCPNFETKNFTDGVFYQKITDGKTFENDSILFNNVLYEKNNYFRRDGEIWGCICNVKQCVRKCCSEKEYFTNNCTEFDDDEIYSYDNVKNVTSENEREFHTIYGKPACPSVLFSADEDNFYLQEDGSLFLSETDIFNMDSYCINVFSTENPGYNELLAAVCTEDEEDDLRLFSAGMIISLPCLFITFLVYFLDPNRNFHGMCLMCYVSTLFCAYVFLIILQLHSDFEMSVCTALGILCYFFFLVSFFWLNIMCIHMWRIGGQQNFSRSKKANRNRFLAYSAYAWGVPLIMTGIVVALRFSFPEESNWLPSIGIRQCWFNDDLQSLIYFYGPVTVLITINITLFAITAIKILKAKKDTAILRKDEKERFNLYSKLVLAMGVNWAMEVISFYFRFVDHMSPKWIWYFTDFCNACYGVFIFFVYAFKKVWTICKVRYYKMTGKPYEEKTVTQSTPRTVTSNVSYATSNNAESTAMIS
ncbi:probable G-protein coupled receptor Mth-like 3 isoform X6 [Agrilus planipennis]|uniref:Probable G-protein coupled receptor Mth-like 3 isoform X6 n=1 Tax=Agrilus planipennis TaxID=224129 RepID=A0A1W4X4A5_AGRPL|nr:probable G-protein coupled receptor Mth-like 3 isoform X6 [Agrilus planipennis]